MCSISKIPGLRAILLSVDDFQPYLVTLDDLLSTIDYGPT